MRGDAFRFKADYFKMHVDNYITGCVTFDFTTFTPFGYFCNTPGTSEVKGVELQATYDAGFAFAGVTYTYTHTDLPSQLDGLGAHSYLPDNITTITGGVRLIDQTLTLGARGYIASQSYIGIDNVAPGASPYVDGYKLLDLFADYQATKDVNVGMTVTNVFDLAYTPALTTPPTGFTGDTGRGRTFLLTTRAQF
jgi:hemoglobin/transferrin/lactoferrin receptor protein